MEGLLQCTECTENFDLDRHRPKLLSCGHTLCHSCARHGSWAGRIVCPSDKREHFASPDNLEDDLQLLCWLEAAAQGVLECVRCGCPFDGLLRRPTALGCGHTVCRVCLQETNDAKLSPAPLARGDSLEDESWEFSPEDELDSYSSTLSISGAGSDPFVLMPSSRATGPSRGDILVDCPVGGCGRDIHATDHHHLLQCLSGSVAPAVKAKSRSTSCDDGLRAELLHKLSLLEIALVQSNKQNTRLPEEGANVNDLLNGLRRVVEDKNSPSCERTDVFLNNTANCAIPDILLDSNAEGLKFEGRGGVCIRESQYASEVDSLKEAKTEVDVWELSLTNRDEMRVKKEKLLHSDSKIWKLTGVDCWCDPEWTLRLLRKAAPHVEQLQLRYPTQAHLQVVRDTMPYLSRLEIRGWSGPDLAHEPFNFEAGPANCRDTIEWLEVFLPVKSALSLLRAHQRSLRKLRFVVSDEWTDATAALSVAEDTPTYFDAVDGFEMGEEATEEFCVVRSAVQSHCWDDLLEVYGHEPSALTSLTLLWPSSRRHDYFSCHQFRSILGEKRQNIVVDCDICRRNDSV